MIFELVLDGVEDVVEVVAVVWGMFEVVGFETSAGLVTWEVVVDFDVVTTWDVVVTLVDEDVEVVVAILWVVVEGGAEVIDVELGAVDELAMEDAISVVVVTDGANSVVEVVSVAVVVVDRESADSGPVVTLPALLPDVVVPVVNAASVVVVPVIDNELVDVDISALVEVTPELAMIVLEVAAEVPVLVELPPGRAVRGGIVSDEVLAETIEVVVSSREVEVPVSVVPFTVVDMLVVTSLNELDPVVVWVSDTLVVFDPVGMVLAIDDVVVAVEVVVEFGAGGKGLARSISLGVGLLSLGPPKSLAKQ